MNITLKEILAPNLKALCEDAVKSIKENETREANDLLRSQIPSIPKPNCLILTNGIANLEHETIGKILKQVKEFDDFSPDNDPYGEHDFGSIKCLEVGKTIYWKIDDYNGQENLQLVLTIMFSDEY